MATTLEQAVANLEALKGKIHIIAGNEMVNDALDNIKKQRDINGLPMIKRKAGSVRNIGRGLLVDTGAGRRSIAYKADGFIVKITAVDYMIAHNEGVNKTVSVRAHSRRGKRAGNVRSFSRHMKLPQREFSGRSVRLTDRIDKIIANQIAKACT